MFLINAISETSIKAFTTEGKLRKGDSKVNSLSGNFIGAQVDEDERKKLDTANPNTRKICYVVVVN